MAEEVLSLVAKVSFEDTDFQKGLRSVQSQAKTAAASMQTVFSEIGNTLKDIGGTLSGWGKTLTVAITAPIAALGVATAKTAIDFLKLKENTRTAFEVLLGSAEKAEKMLKDLYDFAQGSPLSYQSYLETSKQLVAMGVAANDVIPYLDKMTNAAIATGKGELGLNTLAESIGRMSSKGKIQLEELNRMIEMGVPAVKILGNAYGKTEEQIYDMMKKGELLTKDALPKLLEGMNNGTDGVNGATAAYGGLAAKMEGTLTGAIDTVKARFRDMSVVLFDAENSYPILTEILNNFAEAIKVLPKLLEGFTKAITPALTFLNDKIKTLTEYIQNADSTQLERISKILLGLVAAGPILIVVGKLTSALGGLFSAIGSIAGALPAIGSALAAVGSIGFAPILAIVAAVIAVFVFLREEWDKVVATFMGWVEKTGIIQSFQKLWESLQNVWEKIKGLKDLFYVLGGMIVATLLPTIAAIMGVFNGLVKALDGVMKVVGGVIDVWAGVGEVLLGIFTFDGEKIMSGLNTIWQGIKDIFIGAVEAIWGFISGYFEGIWSFISSLLDSIGLTEWLANTWNTLTAWFNNLWASFTEWGNNLWNGITGFFTLVGQLIWTGIQLIANIFEAAFTIIALPFMFIWENCKQYVFAEFNAISTFLINIWNSILSFLMPILQSISDFFVSIWDSISTTITNALTNIWNFIFSIFTNVWNFMVSIFNSILNTVSRVWNAISGIISGIATNIWNSIVSVFNNIKNFITGVWNGIKDTTSSIWNGIKEAIWKPIESAYNTVKGWIDKFKNAFGGFMVHIKMPHFRIENASWNPMDWITNGVPRLKVDWYAKGAVFNDPVAFGINPYSNSVMVGGEAGAEAIAPIDTLQNYIKQAVNEGNSNNLIHSIMVDMYALLSQYLPLLSKRQLVLDTGAVVGELSPFIDYQLGNVNALKVRGNA